MRSPDKPRVPMWAVPAVSVAFVLVALQIAGFQPATVAGAALQATQAASRNLLDDRSPQQQQQPQPTSPQAAAPDWGKLQTRQECFDSEGGEPDQRVCVFEDLVLYNGKLYYVTSNASDSVPPIKIAWLKKFEGDDMFHAEAVNQTQLPWSWGTAQVEEVATAWLGHQQHYSNFYHMFSEVAPSIHSILCKHLKDCTYSSTGGAQLVFVQDWRPDIPKYVMLDSIADTFKCLSPRPVWYKDDAALQGKVIVLRRAVAGVSNEVRAFPEWKEEHTKLYREPPKPSMVAWRQRMADCFGFQFTQAVAPTDPLRILFINRHYREGRHILNQAELADMIRKLPEYKAFPEVDMRLHYLNGEDPIAQQAAQFWNASLLIWPHGATMALTTFLPRGAQAIEVIPWVEEDKAKQSEWVQAIRDSFSLEIDLYAVQNKERRRVMFNQDSLMNYGEYQRATAEQKVALLERGECPPGVDGFVCPFWWNHWMVSVNLDWATLEPALRAALGKLAALRAAGGVLPPTGGQAGAGPGGAATQQQLQGGAGTGAAAGGAGTGAAAGSTSRRR